MQFDLIAVGSATIDEFLTLLNGSEHISLDPSTGELRIKSGEKIPVDSCEFLLGGNAFNVCAGVSRAGFSTALVAEIGTDEFSEKIKKGLKSEGISESLIKQNSSIPSSFSVILNFQKERTIFSEHVKKDHDFNFDNVSANWVYLTSLGEDWKGAYEKTLEYVKTSGAKLAFNPGTLQIKGGKEPLKDILMASDILFLNKGEAVGWTGKENIEEALVELKKLGPKTVVVTDAENGSYLIDESGKVLKHGIAQAEVVEKTGAGDGYASGFLSALLSGKGLEDAMAWGAKNASAVISKVGAQAGLLTKEQLTIDHLPLTV